MSPVIAFLFVYISRLLTAPEMGITMRLQRAREGGGRVQSSDEAEIEQRHRRVGHTYQAHGTWHTRHMFQSFSIFLFAFHIFSCFLFIVSVYSADTFRLRA